MIRPKLNLRMQTVSGNPAIIHGSDYSGATGTKEASDFSSSMEIANSAFRFIQTHMTPPVPRSYEFWYTYAQGNNKKLNEHVNALLQRGAGRLKEYDIEQIHDEHINQNSAEHKLQRETSEGLSNELDTIHEILKGYLTSSENFGEKLSQSLNELPSFKSIDEAADLLREVVAENDRMQKETSQLRAAVESSQEHVDSLEQKLQAAREVSFYDSLTQVRNRRYYDQQLPQELLKASLENLPLCLAVADIDHFKRINDKFGHSVGDGVLKLFANLMSNTVKGRDMVVRYGGEEFVIVLPETQIEDAVTLIEKIRVKLQAINLTVRKTGQTIGNVTASFGIALFEPGDDQDSLFIRADSLLYQAKKGGRNRIVSSPKPDVTTP